MPAETCFLFTDIEGSTRLWEEHPEAMQEALRHHDDLLRACIESHGGRIFKTVGDAFCAAFPQPRAALDAVLGAQEWLPALALTPGDGAPSLRVRMAIHCGSAEERDGDFFGPSLNRLARLLAIGHGGQVLVSARTHQLLGSNLPEGVTLRNRGSHRLRDLPDAEQVYQVCHPELPEDFPALRSLSSHPHNLPNPTTAFIGREAALADVCARLGTCRLLTLIGSGGTGKTRLALEAGAALLEQFPDGVWLTELAALTEAGLVPQALTAALAVSETRGETPMQTLARALEGKTLLLVLDNCEHLLGACAALVDALLRACPGVRFLATSREGLGIAGEYLFRVPSLGLPDRSTPATPESLALSEAAVLFAERARQARADFQVTSENATAVASLCRRLDGIPLALELAAARVRAMPLEQIERRLDQRFRLLTGGSRAALPRHQTLRSLVDWSYDLLVEPEKALLRRLSVFAGGWTLEAAEAICSGDPIEEWEVVDLLTGLCDKSLVIFQEQESGVRYRLLETVRAYARERLVEAEPPDPWRARHGDYFLRLAEAAAPELRGPEQQRWLERLEREHDNLRAALDAYAEDARAERGLRLAGALWRFWEVRGYLTEGRARLREALAQTDEGPPSAARATTMHAAGAMAAQQGDYQAAGALLDHSLAMWREVADPAATALTLNLLGNLAWDRGEFHQARERYEESLALRRQVGDVAGLAGSLGNLASVLGRLGDAPGARALREESLARWREVGDRRAIAIALGHLGIAAYERGDHATARTHYAESLGIRRDLGDRLGISLCLSNLGLAAQALGDAEAARALHEESLAISRELGDRRQQAYSLANLGNLAVEQGNLADARRLQTECLVLRRSLGDRRALVQSVADCAALAAAESDFAAAACMAGAVAALEAGLAAALPEGDQVRVQQARAAAAQALSAPEFSAATSRGAALTLEEVVEEALQAGRGGGPRRPGLFVRG